MTNTLLSHVVWVFLIVFPPDSGMTPVLSGELTQEKCNAMRKHIRGNLLPGITVSECKRTRIVVLPESNT